ncbi:hypothetical protein, partial [Amycolatopsis kentuckyensis]|uniref:hypothetical protein n=1 Tax=Amycolatopsis kentuckyensis TaxID=218823 RepID=UPI001AC0034F
GVAHSRPGDADAAGGPVSGSTSRAATAESVLAKGNRPRIPGKLAPRPAEHHLPGRGGGPHG